MLGAIVPEIRVLAVLGIVSSAPVPVAVLSQVMVYFKPVIPVLVIDFQLIL